MCSAFMPVWSAICAITWSVVPGVRVDRGQAGDRALEVARVRVGLRERTAPALLGQVERRRVVAVDGEGVRRRRCQELAGQRRELVLTSVSMLALSSPTWFVQSHGVVHAVAVGRRGRAADEVIALVDGEDEQRVRLVDAVGRQAREEGREGVVVGLELRDVAGRPGAVGRVRVAGHAVEVVRVRDVRVRDRDAVLLHRGDVGQRDRGLHAVEARETRLAERIGDRLAGQVGQRGRAGWPVSSGLICCAPNSPLKPV